MSYKIIEVKTNQLIGVLKLSKEKVLKIRREGNFNLIPV